MSRTILAIAFVIGILACSGCTNKENTEIPDAKSGQPTLEPTVSDSPEEAATDSASSKPVHRPWDACRGDGMAKLTAHETQRTGRGSGTYRGAAKSITRR